MKLSKQAKARQLNWDKLQLVSAVGHLKFLARRYYESENLIMEIDCIEAAIRRGMQWVADDNAISGNYLETLPFELTRIGKRAKKDQS